MSSFPVQEMEALCTHTPDHLRLAVISDIHIHHDEHKYATESNYVQNMSITDYRVNPFAALRALITQKSLAADFLICSGDITDKAHPGALAHGWELMGEVANELKARTVLAAAGNHDVDSRFGFSEYDAKGAAMRLIPDFPIANRQLANQYWSRHYCIIRGGNYQIVLLNSAAYHGEGAAFPLGDRAAVVNEPEYLHGRISDQTLQSLEADLQNHTYPVNILVCHHHPTRIDAVPDDDYSAMMNGEALISFLSQPGRGRWIIIHGHRHVAAIQRPGGIAHNAGPLTFCAGSFGKVLPAGWPSANQFYILDIHTNPSSVGQSVACEYRSWTWVRNGSGWQPARFDESLPGFGGFGYIGELDALAELVSQTLTPSQPSLTYGEVIETVPNLRFLAPGDWQHLKVHLGNRNVRVSQDADDGELTFIRRATK
jgi:3',5'-cyclic AMP phosphodiesterase CpdA